MGASSDLRELAGPAPEPVEDANVGRWLRRRADAAGDATALATPDDDGDPPRWSPVSWSQLADEVMSIATGLVAAGLQRGDAVIVAGPTRLEWTLVDMAVMSAGGVTVPLYESPSHDQVRSVVEQTSPRMAFVESDEQVALLDDTGADIDVHRLRRTDLGALADAASEHHRAELDERLDSTSPDTLATVVFTSGTTGEPKGVPITHHQLLWTARQTTTHLDTALRGDTSTLLFLPLAHVFARVVVFAALEAGVEVNYGRSIDDIPDDLRAVRPTFLLVVPRLLERVLDGAREQAHGWRRRAVELSFDAARSWSKAGESGRRGPLLRVRHRIADLLVLRRLREGLGGRAQYVVSGGARLDPEVAHVVNGAGITVLEGYGLTETTAQVTVDSPTDARLGTVGTPLPGLRVRLADDGEIQIAGPSVFTGYFRGDGGGADGADRDVDDLNEDAFADGWFRTGDQGEITDDGRLVIRGRTKEVIVTDTGEMVAPSPLEDALREHPAITQAMVVGQDRPFLGALVVVADEKSGDDRRHDDDVRRAVDAVNADRPRHEQVREFRIVHREFSEDEGELTPTMKLRREQIMEHFADDIEALYADARSS